MTTVNKNTIFVCQHAFSLNKFLVKGNPQFFP